MSRRRSRTKPAQSSELVATGVVTVCCGDHRPASDCLCCSECTLHPAVQHLDPEDRAAAACDERDRARCLRLAARRADHLITVAALDDQIADLRHVTAAAVVLAVLDYTRHHPVPAELGDAA